MKSSEKQNELQKEINALKLAINLNFTDQSYMKLTGDTRFQNRPDEYIDFLADWQAYNTPLEKMPCNLNTLKELKEFEKRGRAIFSKLKKATNISSL